MLNQSQNSPVLTNDLLFVRTAMIAAGIIIVLWQTAKCFNHTFLDDYFGWFLIVSFLDVAGTASIFVYIQARTNRFVQSISTFLLIPAFIIAFMLVAVFLSEMFYGGSGYHGEYMFPFFKRTYY